MSVLEIQSAVSSLSESERAELAVWLLGSLPENSGDDAVMESIEEAEKRGEELDSGRTQLLSASEFWSSVEQDRTEASRVSPVGSQ